MHLLFLTDYVKNKKKPDFNEFVNGNLENIVAASHSLPSKPPDLLFAWWRRRFALELNRQNKDHHLLQQLRYQTEGLKALGDTATSSRRILTLTNALADKTTNNSPTESTIDPLDDDTGQRADDNFDGNDGFLFPSTDDTFSTDHRDFQLHRLAEAFFLRNFKDDGESIKGALQKNVATKLLSDHLSSLEEETIKLHLSGIVNLIQSNMSAAVLSSLPDHLKTKLDYTPKTSELDPDTLAYIEQILDFRSDIDGALEYIMTTKATLIRDHKRHSQQYTNLAIIEQIVNNLCLWSVKHDESETTFYRRFASILDTLLADTHVILVDGETSLQSPKVAIAMNKAIFHTGDLSQAYGRKIDLILKCSSNLKVDISSNEWKRAIVSNSIKFHQQSKNLRLNTANLFSLNTKFGVKFTVAMDFVGNSGYLYLLRLVDHGRGLDDYITVAHLVTDLVIPTNIESLGTVKDTLRGLLTLKDHLVNIAWKVTSEHHKLEHASVLEEICPTPSTSSSHSKSPFIFFTPKNNRVQKRKLLQLDDDDDETTVNSLAD
ncbi:hypothetical protein [Absidia glauca]|uniref:Uncharacterized protein n=1 Tax=Absidia glauca TaxID=4829 RepID=A0A168L3N4_ABSGL|nr:hypothetical protein [Absidia glauca]